MTAKPALFITACLAVFMLFCGNGVSTKSGGAAMGSLTVTSTAFVEGDMVPKQYTCDGRDVSPPLSWSGIPDGAKSIALICDDPDAGGDLGSLGGVRHASFDTGSSGTRDRGRGPGSGVRSRRKERLQEDGLWGPVPARRNPPLFLQGLRPRQGTRPQGRCHQCGTGEVDGGTYPRPGPADGKIQPPVNPAAMACGLNRRG